MITTPDTYPVEVASSAGVPDSVLGYLAFRTQTPAEYRFLVIVQSRLTDSNCRRWRRELRSNAAGRLIGT